MDPYLLPGERALWQGRPLRYQPFRRSDLGVVALAVIFLGFAYFWVRYAVDAGGRAGTPIVVQVWGYVIMAFGLINILGPYAGRAIGLRHTRYMITDRRVVILGGLKGARETTAYLKDLPPPVITEKPDGSGDLTFGEFPGFGAAIVNSLMRGKRRRQRAWSDIPIGIPVLWAVPDVRFARDFAASARADQ